MATPENILKAVLPKTELPPTPESTPQEQAQVTDQVPDQEPPLESAPVETEPVKLADLARQLEIEPEQLFAAVNSDGITAADAFAAVKSAGDLDAEREKFEQSQNGLRLEKAQALQEIGDYIAALPTGSIDEKVKEKVQTARAKMVDTEQRLLLAAVEEWKDPAQKTADVELITKYVAQFGLTEADLAVVTDHRWMLMYRHIARQQSRLNAILDKAAKPKPKGQKKASVPISPSSGGTDITALVNANRN